MLKRHLRWNSVKIHVWEKQVVSLNDQKLLNVPHLYLTTCTSINYRNPRVIRMGYQTFYNATFHNNRRWTFTIITICTDIWRPMLQHETDHHNHLLSTFLLYDNWKTTKEDNIGTFGRMNASELGGIMCNWFPLAECLKYRPFAGKFTTVV